MILAVDSSPITLAIPGVALPIELWNFDTLGAVNYLYFLFHRHPYESLRQKHEWRRRSLQCVSTVRNKEITQVHF